LQVTIQNFFDEGKEGTLVLLNDGVGDGSHPSVGPSLTLVKVLTTSTRPMGRGNRIAPRFADEKVEEGRLAYSDTVAPHAQPGKVATQSFDFPIETLLLRRALLLGIDQIRFDVMESKGGTGSFRVGMLRPRMRSRRGMLLEPKIASFSTSTSSRSDETRCCIKSYMRG
jgi:hypothetical protein